LAGAHRTFWLLLDTSPLSPPAHHRQNYVFLEGLSLIDIDSLPIRLSAGLNVREVQGLGQQLEKPGSELANNIFKNTPPG
jgi:hypothetical protein